MVLCDHSTWIYITFKTSINRVMIFCSNERIDDIKKQLVPVITNTWINEKPYQYYDQWNNQALNENNPITKNVSESLYNIFLNRINTIFKNYTIYEKNDRIVCSYVSNKDFKNANWHNHNAYGSISGVFYLKCVEGCGIKFRNKGQVKYIEPKENELYIFPSNLDHYPLPSTSEELRISCNMNLMCKESINELFDKHNLFTFNHIK